MKILFKDYCTFSKSSLFTGNEVVPQMTFELRHTDGILQHAFQPKLTPFWCRGFAGLSFKL